MILEMKVPSPGESITEVEIAEWLVQDGDYVEKDQAIAEVDSDKATLELPAEVSGTITLKAEEGDAVAVGEVVCLIDTSAEKPEGEYEDCFRWSSDLYLPLFATRHACNCLFGSACNIFFVVMYRLSRCTHATVFFGSTCNIFFVVMYRLSRCTTRRTLKMYILRFA